MQRLLTDIDGQRHAAFAAELADTNGWTPLGIGRVIRTGGGAEVAFEVVDAWQGRGIGRRLLTALRHRAAALGYSQIVAVALLALRRGRIEIAPADRGKVVLLSTGNWCAS